MKNREDQPLPIIHRKICRKALGPWHKDLYKRGRERIIISSAGHGVVGTKVRERLTGQSGQKAFQ